MSQSLPAFQTTLRVRVMERDYEVFPSDDDRLGESLWSMLSERIGRPIPPVLFVFRADQVDVVELMPILQEGLSLHRFTSAAAGQADVQAVALLGTPTLLRDDKPLGRVASSFIEWTDNRWWQATLPLDDQFMPLREMPREVRRAVDGFPKPNGVGAWFSTARFFRLKLGLRRAEPEAESPIVH
jgi:hypothetical protein